MSWYSDREDFDEYDPPYCAGCQKYTNESYCRRCRKEHDIDENEDYYREGE